MELEVIRASLYVFKLRFVTLRGAHTSSIPVMDLINDFQQSEMVVNPALYAPSYPLTQKMYSPPLSQQSDSTNVSHSSVPTGDVRP